MSKQNRRQLQTAVGVVVALGIVILLLTGALRFSEEGLGHELESPKARGPSNNEQMKGPEHLSSEVPREDPVIVRQTAASGTTVELFGGVRGKPFDTPLSKAQLQVHVTSEHNRIAEVYQAMTDVHGNYSVLLEVPEAVLPSDLIVRAEIHHPLCRPGAVSIKTEVLGSPAGNTPQRVRGDLAVERVFPIEGRLAPSAGADLATAEVLIVTRVDCPQPLVHLARTRMEGTGVFKGLLSEWPEDAVAVVALLDNHIPAYTDFMVEKAEVTDIGLIEFETGASISGQVRTSLPPDARPRQVGLQARAVSDGIRWFGPSPARPGAP